MTVKINCGCMAVGAQSECLDCFGDEMIEPEVGMLVRYAPPHAIDGTGIPDYTMTEVGFITSFDSRGVFCRFFLRHDRINLRTTTCSELCPPENLWYQGDSEPMYKARIEELLEELEYGDSVTEGPERGL